MINILRNLFVLLKGEWSVEKWGYNIDNLFCSFYKDEC